MVHGLMTCVGPQRPVFQADNAFELAVVAHAVACGDASHVQKRGYSKVVPGESQANSGAIVA